MAIQRTEFIEKDLKKIKQSNLELLQSEEKAVEAQKKAENKLKTMKDTMELSRNLLNDNREDLDTTQNQVRILNDTRLN